MLSTGLVGSANQKDQLDASSSAFLSGYHFGRGIPSPSQMTACSASTSCSSWVKMPAPEELLNQLLKDPPSPRTNTFQDLWSALDPYATSSSCSSVDPLASVQVSFQDTTPSDVASACSDCLMPAPSTFTWPCLDASSSSTSSSSTFSGASSPTLTRYTAPALQESGVGTGMPHIEPASTQAWSTSSVEESMAEQPYEANAPAYTQPQPFRNQETAKFSREGRQWPQVESLASWLDQDICPDFPDHKSGPTSCNHTRPSSPKIRPRSPSHRSRSSSSAFTLVPLVDPRGLLWAAVMMNGMANGGVDSSATVASPESGRSTMNEDESSGEVEAMDEAEGACDGDALSPRSCALSPEPAQFAFEPLAALTAAGLGRGRAPSWPIPGNLVDLQQNLLAASHATFGRSRHCGKPRPSTSAGTSSGAYRKQKMDAVYASAARRRSYHPEHRERRSRSSSAASESKPDSEPKNAAVASSLDKALCMTKLSQTEPSRQPSCTRPSSSGTGSGSNGATAGFSITDSIVLRPRPGTDNVEIAYPCTSDSLQDTQKNAGPPLDKDPNGEEAVEQVQNLFPSDLYAPRFTRRGKYGREGWCSLCRQGEWYSMKRSQYLYHMQFDHGISSLTKRFFHPPRHLRIWNDAMQKTEGLCHHCKKWIPICFGPARKRDFKVWFKHARKCHRDDTGCPI